MKISSKIMLFSVFNTSKYQLIKKLRNNYLLLFIIFLTNCLPVLKIFIPVSYYSISLCEKDITPCIYYIQIYQGILGLFMYYSYCWGFNYKNKYLETDNYYKVSEILLMIYTQVNIIDLSYRIFQPFRLCVGLQR